MEDMENYGYTLFRTIPRTAVEFVLWGACLTGKSTKGNAYSFLAGSNI